jgi:geranylgeranylglycerol-phosphate geranylgeranyltransferase
MRPLNSTTAAIAVVVALQLAMGSEVVELSVSTYLSIALAAFLVTAHAMVHNDIVDYEIDKINAPKRAIPSGKVTMFEAKIWAIFLFLLALLSGFIADMQIDIDFPFSVFWASLNILILDMYNLYFKKSGILGNLIIGYVVSALFLYADLVINSRLTLRTESIGLYAFFLIWGREVYKGIRDIEGDKAHGIKTIPVRFGARGGAIVGSIIILIGVIWSVPLIFNPNVSIIVPILLIVLDCVFIYWCYKIIRDPSIERAQHTKLWLLRSLLIALIILAIEQISRNYILK